MKKIGLEFNDKEMFISDYDKLIAMAEKPTSRLGNQASVFHDIQSVTFEQGNKRLAAKDFYSLTVSYFNRGENQFYKENEMPALDF